MQLEKQPERIHDKPVTGQLLDYRIADPKTLRIERVPDRPVEVVYPEEANKGLWGGEGIVKGFVRYRILYGVQNAKMWFPALERTVVYCEILDKHLEVTVTRRALELMDKFYGLDNYLLKTPDQDFNSQLALQLKRKLLIALAKQDYHPDDPIKKAYVTEKYKEFVIPLEEAEWFGLTVMQAVTKSKIMEASAPQPLKVKFARELIERLEAQKEQDKTEPSKISSWKNKIFGS
jgi:large subunit ribosomal protein L28